MYQRNATENVNNADVQKH